MSLRLNNSNNHCCDITNYSYWTSTCLEYRRAFGCDGDKLHIPNKPWQSLRPSHPMEPLRPWHPMKPLQPPNVAEPLRPRKRMMPIADPVVPGMWQYAVAAVIVGAIVVVGWKEMKK